MPVALGEVAGGIINNKIYYVGDGNSSTLRYDLSSKTWKSTLARRPTPAKDHLSEVYNGKLYLFGGVYYKNGQQVLNKVQIYNPSSNTWTQNSSMPFKTLAAQTALINGEIYVAGGVTSGNVTTKKFAKYNPSTNRWSTLPDMPVARDSGAAGTDGKKLYIFGGRNNGDRPGNGFSNVLIYDVATRKWENSDDPASKIKDLPQARGGIVKAPFVNGEFYVIGGETVDGAGATANHVYKRVDIYNPTTNTWRRGPDMPTGRHGITPLKSGSRIFVAGGGIVSGKSESKVFEILQT